ncbi:MAG: hypothetical protein M1813_003122 [Trichoglossum hirsutum]|nr:MAG: hypothetical protein M1813_003122 [Trichoglossum hirsutum]
MDLLAGVRKEGSRGGRANFKWEDVKDDAHRENYLGHSLKAPVGRWQKNRDLSWYAKGDNDSESISEEEARREEIRRIKEAEQDALSAALGFKVEPRKRDDKGVEEEVRRVVKETVVVGDEDEKDGGRGVGFGGGFGGMGNVDGGDEILGGVGVREGEEGGLRDMIEKGRKRSRDRDMEQKKHRERRHRRSRTPDRNRDRHRHRHHHQHHHHHRRHHSRSRSRTPPPRHRHRHDADSPGPTPPPPERSWARRRSPSRSPRRRHHDDDDGDHHASKSHRRRPRSRSPVDDNRRTRDEDRYRAERESDRRGVDDDRYAGRTYNRKRNRSRSRSPGVEDYWRRERREDDERKYTRRRR